MDIVNICDVRQLFLVLYSQPINAIFLAKITETFCDLRKTRPSHLNQLSWHSYYTFSRRGKSWSDKPGQHGQHGQQRGRTEYGDAVFVWGHLWSGFNTARFQCRLRGQWVYTLVLTLILTAECPIYLSWYIYKNKFTGIIFLMNLQ